MLTTLLDLLGAALLVAAAYVLAGPGAALAVAGVGVLVVSWGLSGRPLPTRRERSS